MTIFSARLTINMEKWLMISGECFCGEIKFEIDGVLGQTTSCHCSRCRKAFSAQASAAARVEPGQFRWVAGADKLASYVGEHGFGIGFCSRCGSTLCTLYEGAVYQVTLGCVNGDPQVGIDRHIFVGSKAAWETFPEDLPPGTAAYAEGPTADDAAPA
ncbi:MAG: GFA family protein [Pseudomonadota bacterium]